MDSPFLSYTCSKLTVMDCNCHRSATLLPSKVPTMIHESYSFPEVFEQQVRDCLVHLYDFTALQNDPVAEQLAPQLGGVQRVQMVRQIVIDAIENLKLNAAPQSRNGRVYNLLFLRYVEEQSTQELLQHLALSERQFYREHRR